MVTRVVAAVATVVAAGCGTGYGGAAAPPPCTLAGATAVGSAIALSGMEFVPSCAKVAAGTAVTFTNDDSFAHTVTSDAGQADVFDSGTLAPAGQFAHTFATAGTEHVHCNIHPNMHLTVFVQ